MISVPIAVHNDNFKWQLDLFWHTHKQIYGDTAYDKFIAAVIKRNFPHEQKVEVLEWEFDVPHVMCESVFDMLGDIDPSDGMYLPLNIQIGLLQLLPKLDDDKIIEVLDCDMFHIRPHPDIFVRHDELIVDDIYEPWHLKSLSEHRSVIEMYFENGGRFYNGGFVPIIGTVKTLKRIMFEWISVHRHILTRALPEKLRWWAGMYALQVACEKKQVRMRAENYCYIPGINELEPSHYIAHYSCDERFDKKRYPKIDVATFEDNIFYNRLQSWPNFLKV
jgi:hypothetical protein